MWKKKDGEKLLFHHFTSFWAEIDLGLFLRNLEHDQGSKIFWTGESKQILIYVGGVEAYQNKAPYIYSRKKVLICGYSISELFVG